MNGNERSYHAKRAVEQRRMAEKAANPVVASAHGTLADLHEARAGGSVRTGKKVLTLFPQP